MRVQSPVGFHAKVRKSNLSRFTDSTKQKNLRKCVRRGEKLSGPKLSSCYIGCYIQIYPTSFCCVMDKLLIFYTSKIWSGVM